MRVAWRQRRNSRKPAAATSAAGQATAMALVTANGMTAGRKVDRPAPIIPGRARFYTRSEKTGRVENAPYVDNSYKWAGGGFLSTAEDLVTFASALLDGRLLRPETVQLLWTSMKTTDGKDTDYGIGWTVDRDSKGRRRVRHSGGAMGGTANLVIYPDLRLAVALLVGAVGRRSALPVRRPAHPAQHAHGPE